MESVKDKLIAKINEISERYEYYGFWKLGTAYVDNVSREENPYLYFPSEEYAHKAMMEEFNSLTEDEFVPLETIGFLYFKDGDKLDIPFEVFKQKPEIHIGVPYNSDEPCEVSVSYKRPENEIEVYGRLLVKIMHNARHKYINTLKLIQ
jgi:hypothetical protein